VTNEANEAPDQETARDERTQSVNGSVGRWRRTNPPQAPDQQCAGDERTHHRRRISNAPVTNEPNAGA
jgi:hypothetical protein